METTNAAPTAQGYSRRILREVKLLDAIVLGILPATVQPLVAHSLSTSPNWKDDIVAAVISYGTFFVAYCLYMISKATIKIWRENSEEIRELRDFKAANSEKLLLFFSPGVAVSLNRAMASVAIHLVILSSEALELTYIHLTLSGDGLNVTCEKGEPISITKFDVIPKTFNHKLTPQEVEQFQKGSIINLNGYVKFRDSNGISEQRIALITIANG